MAGRLCVLFVVLTKQTFLHSTPLQFMIFEEIKRLTVVKTTAYFTVKSTV